MDDAEELFAWVQKRALASPENAENGRQLAKALVGVIEGNIP